MSKEPSIKRIGKTTWILADGQYYQEPSFGDMNGAIKADNFSEFLNKPRTPKQIVSFLKSEGAWGGESHPRVGESSFLDFVSQKVDNKGKTKQSPEAIFNYVRNNEILHIAGAAENMVYDRNSRPLRKDDLPVYRSIHEPGQEKLIGKYATNNGKIAFVDERGKKWVSVDTKGRREELEKLGYDHDSFSVPYSSGEIPYDDQQRRILAKHEKTGVRLAERDHRRGNLSARVHQDSSDHMTGTLEKYLRKPGFRAASVFTLVLGIVLSSFKLTGFVISSSSSSIGYLGGFLFIVGLIGLVFSFSK